jgi:hypothetical protein
MENLRILSHSSCISQAINSMDTEKNRTYATRRGNSATENIKKRRYLREVEMRECYYNATLETKL